jgi:hypothetical protein
LFRNPPSLIRKEEAKMTAIIFERKVPIGNTLDLEFSDCRYHRNSVPKGAKATAKAVEKGKNKIDRIAKMGNKATDIFESNCEDSYRFRDHLMCVPIRNAEKDNPVTTPIHTNASNMLV